MRFFNRLRVPSLVRLGLAACLSMSAAGSAGAEALLLLEADSGKVLHAENATYPWRPASVTKLMTLYVTLQAVKEGKIGLDTMLTVSPVAMAQQPSKMGFNTGTQLTVDNALKMLMVKSANDMAVVLAEGVAGSVDAFAEQMNSTAQRLGMTQTHYVNPNGLPEDAQVTSARDQGILARAVLRDLPEYDLYWHIPAIKFGKRVMRNTNSLLGRYPGVDGMKTGFICASGFNVVASATRGGRRLIAVVLGSPSSAVRSVKAAQLFERGFNSGGPLSWLTPSLGTVDALVPVNAEPADLRDQTCGKHRRRPAAESVDDEDESESGADSGSPRALFLANHRGAPKPSTLLGPPAPVVNPVVVFVGAPKRGGPLLAAASAAEAAGGRPGRKGTGGTVPAEPALAAAASPWPNLASPFTPSEAVAATAAQGLSSSPAVQAVPLPRPRPRVRPAAQPRAGAANP